MENIQALIEKIKVDIQNGKSEEEIFQSLLLFSEKIRNSMDKWLTACNDPRREDREGPPANAAGFQ